MDALKRFFTDLEGNATQAKLKTDKKLEENKKHDRRMLETKNSLYNKRRSNDIFNATQHSDKKERENLWRRSTYVEPGIEGKNGYPGIEVPSSDVLHT